MRTWLPIEIGIGRHRKTRELARIWNTKPQTVVGVLVDLWGYLLEYQPDGNVAAIPSADLEHIVCDANGARVGVVDTTIEELQRAGFVDPDGHAHDWEEYAGAIIARREKQRKRMKELRKRERAGDANGERHVTRTLASREGVTAQHSTAQQINTSSYVREHLVGIAAIASYDAYRKPHRHPDVLDAQLIATAEPEHSTRPVRGATWESVSVALAQLAANNEPFNESRLRGYLRRDAEQSAGASKAPASGGAHPFREADVA